MIAYSTTHYQSGARVVRNSGQGLPGTSPSVVTLGKFNGMHSGHASLLDRVARARERLGPGYLSVVACFYPSPEVVLGRVRQIEQLATLRQTHRLVSRAGIDWLYLIHFTPNYANLSAEEFLDREVLGNLRATHLVVGRDAAVGKARRGDAAFMKEFFARRGNCEVEIVEPVVVDGKRVSSQAVRELIYAGRVDRAARLLGRLYALEGRVVHGVERGRELGFPTANLRMRDQAIPGIGVYACRVVLPDRIWPAVTNIGVRPTFGGSERAVEAHILDWDGSSLYGQRLELEFVARLREERKFQSRAELVEQIKRDVQQTREILRETSTDA